MSVFVRIPWLILLILGSAAGYGRAAPAPALNVRCNADLVCVEVQKSDALVTLRLESRTDKPLTFGLFFSSNLAYLNPERIQLRAKGNRQLVSFPLPRDPWGFDYRIHYGHHAHVHDDDFVYTLPFAPDDAYRVTQDYRTLTTHRLGNRFAIDWEMPVGSHVHAARGGAVVSTYGDSKASSLGGSALANHIWIRHDDGTIGKYLHLEHRGVLVREGQRVDAGERIGSSGDTGFASGAHLHFSVSTLGGDAVYQTFNVLFATETGPHRLTSGRRYRRPADG